MHELVALVIGLARILEPAGVLHGHGLAGGRGGAVALLDGSLGNTHDDRCSRGIER